MILERSFDSLGQRPSALTDLAGAFAVTVNGVFARERCEAYLASLYTARAEWTSDFGDEQFCLGRAFYTHFEQDRCRQYFADARASDERVERRLPGLQARLGQLVAAFTGGTQHARRGFCGAGVHVFPAGEKVAREGGVIHFDTEGLPDHHARRRKRALSLVVMLQRPDHGGGLKLWSKRYAGHGAPDSADLRGPMYEADYAVGSALVFDSYRLHQIQPFSGQSDRISATLHAAEIDENRWETWF
ncbi:MAG: 2OG-Fe(II) oxygenase [Polyangiaceae bacterium]